jgi:hypothetical protein
VQSKSLVDLIQLECLSQSSSVLKITNGPREGKIWILNGEIIDAVAGEASGRAAFKEIFLWKTGAFEILPAEPDRTRTIHESYQGILLDSAQALDEAQQKNATTSFDKASVSRMARVAKNEGVELALEISPNGKIESWGVEQPEPMSNWTNETWKSLRQLGEKLRAGELKQVHALGLQRHAALAGSHDKLLCIGLKRTLTSFDVRETMKKILEQWGS